MAKVKHAHQINTNCTEIDDLVTKTVFGSKKLSLIERRYFFGEKIKLVQSGSFSPFFYFTPTMAKVEPAHQINTNSTKLTIWWPKQFSLIEKLSLIERGYIFLEKKIKLVQSGSFSSFFLFYPQLWLRWSLPTINEHNSTEINNLVTKTMFIDRKSQASLSADTFFEIDKIVQSGSFSPFFYFIPNYGWSGACPPTMNTIWLKLTIWWPKQFSVIEEVKPHRERILFWK